MRLPVAASLLLAIMALALAACGGGKSDEDQITKVIETASTTTSDSNCTNLQTCGSAGSKADPLENAPFAARRVLPVGSGHELLIGTTPDPADSKCEKLAAVWIDRQGQIERAVRIPQEDCIDAVYAAARGKGGEVTVSVSIFHPGDNSFEDDSSRTPDLIRIQPDGDLDPAFGGGVVQTSAPSFGLFSDGSLVAGDGRHYLNNGQVDLQFGGGRQFAPIADSTFSNGLAVFPDDSFAALSLKRDQQGAVLQRFTPNGRIDRSFGSQGATLIDIDPRHKSSFETDLGPLLPTPDKGLLGFGLYTPGSAVNSRYVLLKYRRNGKLDRAFAQAGRLLILPRPYAGHSLSVGQIGVQGNGKPLAVARAGGHHQTTLVLRYRRNGRPDPSFGSAGIARLAIGNGRRCNLVELQGGKLLGAVGVDGGGSTVYRLRRDGGLDPSFGNGGLATVRP